MQNSENQSLVEQQVVDTLKARLQEFYQEFYLSEFQKFAVEKFIRDYVIKKDNIKVIRIREWLLLKLNHHRFPNLDSISPMQRGCPEIIPLLTATPYWDNDKFAWIMELQNNIEIIKGELLQLRNEHGFQPYRGPSWASDIKASDGIGSQSNDSGQWNVFYLFLHEIKFEDNCKKVPKTVQLIEQFVPRHYQHAFFSAVTPHTHIIKHHGSTNKKLRIHIPLIGFQKSRLRVADQIIEQVAGKCYVFDDSFEHEAWHDGEETRIVLIVDFWHPDLSDEEVKFLSLLQRSKMRQEHKLSEIDPEKDNYFSIIEQSRNILKDNDWWLQSQ